MCVCTVDSNINDTTTDTGTITTTVNDTLHSPITISTTTINESSSDANINCYHNYFNHFSETYFYQYYIIFKD